MENEDDFMARGKWFHLPTAKCWLAKIENIRGLTNELICTISQKSCLYNPDAYPGFVERKNICTVKVMEKEDDFMARGK